LQFNHKFEGANRDVHLIEKLKTELPGIFNLALEGAAGIIERGAFTICPSSEKIKKEWRKESDQVAQFTDDCCDLAPGLYATSRDVWNAYKTWAMEAGIKRTLNRNNFSTRLGKLGVIKSRGHGGTRMFAGIRLQEIIYQGSNYLG
jgi:putative DNA primase/helicase